MGWTCRAEWDADWNNIGYVFYLVVLELIDQNVYTYIEQKAGDTRLVTKKALINIIKKMYTYW